MDSKTLIQNNIRLLLDEQADPASVESFGDMNDPIAVVHAAHRLGVPLSRLMEGVR